MNFLRRMRDDVQTVFQRDPAARSTFEVVFCYPGLHALWLHRVAHFLWQRRWPLTARLVSHFSRHLTGVEIHPGAAIGRRVFIDHGMGVVIGETAEIGDDVLMYQGVVLGGTSRSKAKRHPTIEAEAVIGAGATVLGPIVVGKGARVGSGSVVVHPVPPGASVVGVPAHTTERRRRLVGALEHGELPDPIAEAVAEVRSELVLLQDRLSRLEQQNEEQRGGEEASTSEQLQRLLKLLKENLAGERIVVQRDAPPPEEREQRQHGGDRDRAGAEALAEELAIMLERSRDSHEPQGKVGPAGERPPAA